MLLKYKEALNKGHLSICTCIRMHKKDVKTTDRSLSVHTGISRDTRQQGNLLSCPVCTVTLQVLKDIFRRNSNYFVK